MTKACPGWLPVTISVDGDWRNNVLPLLYSVFVKDFKQTRRMFENRPVWWDIRIVPGGVYEEGFWHLITRIGSKTTERLFDPRRAERLPWCGPTISNSSDVAVKVWDFKEASGRLRTYLWLEDWDYAIVLEKKQERLGEVAFLVTAFYVDGESRRKSLRGKYAKKMN
ncbi:hypothetical protein E3J62_08160 [candidate division TA06 bacterium]|uniref:Uncharacterized protein n=1 Tax=candidate division TA06 bacterium TaxID=2250710 RepID=A0A523URQ1_UNCT6|nr:MAG: hypothetical protein E3J62_08160 [candidate division TA06 bacterium]